MMDNFIEYVERHNEKIIWFWPNDPLVHLYITFGCNQLENVKNVVRIIHYWLNPLGAFDTHYLSYNLYDVDKITQRVVNEGKTTLMEYTIDPSILVYDYEKIKEKCGHYEEELIQKCLHPKRMARHLYEYNYDILCDEYY